ncbi:MAG TPA: DUF5668 domain-containing protein [Candidatus Eisenbacteria bacterium]
MSFGRLFAGALLVGVGIVLLGMSLGYLSGDIWPSLLQYWPLLIVAVGIAFLARAIRNIVLGWISAIIVVGGLLLGAWWFTTHQPKSRGTDSALSLDLAKPPVTSVTLRARSLLGRIEVGAGKDTVRAIRLAVLHVPEKLKAAHGWTVVGRAGILDWPAPGAASGLSPLGGELHVDLPPRTPVRLDLRAHLSTLDADLRSLRAERATFRVIGSSVRIAASDLGQPQRIRIQGMLSNATVRLPANAPARVVYSKWFGLRRMPPDFIEHLYGRSKDRIFRSEGRGGSILVEADGPLLRVQIERAPVRAVERPPGDREPSGARTVAAAAPRP